ncbi:hypothetical protein K7X08_003105 [Anisodus acutangulus]|uniref:Uncharacterized protein n=1 Tax=Anisodus acutangulus TaxID=402998 RepID=A0A9Q1MD12_9SOLA|nr:hypothetical protein K7X08_003105 [Anisodus acutangulus]
MIQFSKLLEHAKNLDSFRIYSSKLSYNTEELHYWRDNFTHRCHSLEEYIMSWPDKPTKYRRSCVQAVETVSCRNVK